MADDPYFNSAIARSHAAEIGFVTGMYVTINKGRNAKGQFTSYQQQAKDENAYNARRLQNIVAENIQTGLKRPNVSTGRLARVTQDSRNARSLGTDGFYVGNYEFLNKSDAKYWRTIEFGTAAVWTKPWIGMKLPGVWGGTIAGWGTNRWGEVPHAGEPFTRAGRGSGGKFRPFGGKTRARMLQSDNVPEVRNHIAPMHAYREAWREFGGETTLRRQQARKLRRLQD